MHVLVGMADTTSITLRHWQIHTLTFLLVLLQMGQAFPYLNLG